MRPKRPWPVLLLGLLLAGFGAHGQNGEPNTAYEINSYTPSLAGVRRVVAYTFTGNLRVQLNPKATPSVRVVRFARTEGALRDVAVSLERAGPDLVVRARDASGAILPPEGLGASVTVVLPAPLEVKLQNTEGELEVVGMRGRAYLRGSRGAVRIAGLRDAVVDAEVARGPITARDVTFRVGSASRLVSGFGNVSLVSPRLPTNGELRLQTAVGSARAALSGFQRFGNDLRRAGPGPLTRVELTSGLGGVSVSD